MEWAIILAPRANTLFVKYLPMNKTSIITPLPYYINKKPICVCICSSIHVATLLTVRYAALIMTQIQYKFRIAHSIILMFH